jgi:hypothetical protein
LTWLCELRTFWDRSWGKLYHGFLVIVRTTASTMDGNHDGRSTLSARFATILNPFFFLLHSSLLGRVARMQRMGFVGRYR